ncbi:MAG: hypothetical protein MUC49_02175 [Raineya sp.]|jgi:hypothetical protein|nr:hypothetical protein [Raineya sp.]
MKFTIKIKELKEYLETLKADDFQAGDGVSFSNPNGIIKEGFSISDIEKGFYKNKNIPSDQIINYGDSFLVDALGNDLSILIKSRRKYKLPDGRVVHAKYYGTVIKDCRKLYGTPLNGYWIIPPQFIEKTK